VAMINCPECSKEISDKAQACPNCGAPVDTASTASIPVPSRKKKTHPITWLILISIIAATAWWLPSAMREENLPEMPVEVKYRNAMLGPGLVLSVKNTSDRYLSFVLELKNPSTAQEKSFRLNVDPKKLIEIGHSEGWVLSSGDTFRLSNHDYKPHSGRIP